MRLVVAGACLTFATVAAPQGITADEQQRVAVATLVYMTCVKVYGPLHAAGPATAFEVADAALDACHEAEVKLADTVRALLRDRVIVNQIIEDARRNARYAAIRAVVEARDPKKP